MIIRIDPKHLDPMVRPANKHLMDQFIAADRYGRRHLDPRKSFILYTANLRFGYAMSEMPSRKAFRNLYRHSPVRYWSKGV